MVGSVLDAFYVLFKAENSDLRRGAAESKEIVKKVGTELTNTNTISQKLGNSLFSATRGLAGIVGSLLSAGALVAGSMAAARYANQLKDLSDVLGVNVADLSAWGDAVKKNGGSIEGFQQTVRNLTGSLEAFATKGKSLVEPYFKELGVRMTDAKGKARGVMDILPELADKFSKLSKKESFGLGQKMGLDQGTIMLLQQGRREVELVIARQKELGIATKEDAEIAAKFNNQWDDTIHAFRSVFVTANSTILPVFTTVLKSFEKVALFMRKHSSFLVSSLIAIGSAIAVFVVPPLIAMGVAAAPFILIGTVIAGLILLVAGLIDEIYNFEKGNKTLLGFIFLKWPQVKAIYDGIKGALVNLVEWSKRFGKGVAEAWGAFIEWGKGALDFFMSVIDKIIGAYKKVKDFFGIDDNDSETVATKIIKNDLTFEQATSNINKAKGALSFANSLPLNSVSNSAINRNVTVQTGPITIQTQATDADGISRAINDSLEKQMRQAVDNYADGVAY